MYVEVEEVDASVNVVAWDPVDAGVEVTDSTDRSAVGFSSGSVEKPVSEELAAELIPDASPVALAEGEPVAWAEEALLSDRVIVSQGTSLSLVLEAWSLAEPPVDDASSLADGTTGWTEDWAASEVDWGEVGTASEVDWT
jgi:hypothetical protein